MKYSKPIIYSFKRLQLMFFGFSYFLYSQSPDPTLPDFSPARIINGYTLVWSEEFNTDNFLDDSKWSFEEGFVRNEELQWYQKENAVCKDGVLLIEGKKDTILNTSFEETSEDWRLKRNFAQYSSASINTKNKASWKFGIFEIRAKIDTTRGSWPAIWTLGNELRWPDKGEIDIMEFYIKNEKQSILANVAWKGESNQVEWQSQITPLTQSTKLDDDWTNKFHTWKMIWTQNYIKIFMDDVLLNSMDITKVSNPDGFNPFLQEHYLLLNLAIGSNGGIPLDAAFPITYEVDYVRVYQKD